MWILFFLFFVFVDSIFGDISSLIGTNLPHTGAVSVTISGQTFGSSSTLNCRSNSQTSNEATIYISTTSIVSKPGGCFLQTTNLVAATIPYADHRTLFTSTNIFTYNNEQSSSISPGTKNRFLNSPITGSCFMVMVSAPTSVGLSGLTRIRSSSASSTLWISVSSLVAKTPTSPSSCTSQALLSFTVVRKSASGASLSLTSALSLDKIVANAVSSAKATNILTSGSVSVTIVGMSSASLTEMFASSKCRIGKSGFAAHSSWNSFSSMGCKASPGLSSSVSSLQTTLPLQYVNTLAASMISLDAVFALSSSVIGTNGPSTASISITLLCAPVFAQSQAARMLSSSLPISYWSSDTSLSSKTCVATGKTLGLISSMVYTARSTTSLAFTINNIGILSGIPANIASTGSRSVTLIIRSSYPSMTQGTKLRDTSSQAVQWVSLSSMVVKSSRLGNVGTMTAVCATSTPTVTFTARNVVSSDAAVLFYNVPSRSNLATTGATSVTLLSLSGSAVPLSSPQASLEKSSSSSTKWVSDSSIQALPSSASYQSQSAYLNILAITVQLAARASSSISRSFSLDNAALQGGTMMVRANGHATAAISVTIFALGLLTSQVSSSANLRIGGFGTCVSARQWTSETSIQCKTISGVNFPTRTTNIVASTKGNLRLTVTKSFSFDLFSLPSFLPASPPATGATRVTIVQFELPIFDCSGQHRFGGTACDSSAWVSATSMKAKAPFSNQYQALSVGVTALSSLSVNTGANPVVYQTSDFALEDYTPVDISKSRLLGPRTITTTAGAEISVFCLTLHGNGRIRVKPTTIPIEGKISSSTAVVATLPFISRFDGLSFLHTQMLTVAGSYSMIVTSALEGLQTMNSPISITIVPGSYDASTSRIEDDKGLLLAGSSRLAGSNFQYRILPLDSYGNLLAASVASSLSFSVSVLGTAMSFTTIGLAMQQMYLTRSGNYTISVQRSSTAAIVAPFAVITSQDSSISSFVVVNCQQGQNASSTTASCCNLQFLDTFGNAIAFASPAFLANLRIRFQDTASLSIVIPASQVSLNAPLLMVQVCAIFTASATYALALQFSEYPLPSSSSSAVLNVGFPLLSVSGFEPSNSILSVDDQTPVLAGEPFQVYFSPRDLYGNPVTLNSWWPNATLQLLQPSMTASNLSISASSYDPTSSIMSYTTTSTKSGCYSLLLYSSNISAIASYVTPFCVVPSHASPVRSSVMTIGSKSYAGAQFIAVVTVRDSYGNIRKFGSDAVVSAGWGSFVAAGTQAFPSTAYRLTYVTPSAASFSVSLNNQTLSQTSVSVFTVPTTAIQIDAAGSILEMGTTPIPIAQGDSILMVAGVLETFYCRLVETTTGRVISLSTSSSAVVTWSLVPGITQSTVLQQQGVLVLDTTLQAFKMSLTVTVAGSYALSVTVNAIQVRTSPVSITVLPNDPNPSPFSLATTIATAGIPLSFSLLAKDQYGNTAATAAPYRTAPSTSYSNSQLCSASASQIAKSNAANTTTGASTVTCNVDPAGKYTISWLPTISSSYLLTVALLGSPTVLSLTVNPGQITAASSSCDIPQVATAGLAITISVFARDIYGNKVVDPGNVFTVAMNGTIGAKTISQSATDMSSYSLTPTISGSYPVSVIYGNGHVQSSPWPVMVLPSAASTASVSISSSSALSTTSANSTVVRTWAESFIVWIRLVDAYKNAATVYSSQAVFVESPVSSFSLQPAATATPSVFTATLLPTVSGVYQCSVYINNRRTAVVTATATAGPADAPNSVILVSNTAVSRNLVAGSSFNLTYSLRDANGMITASNPQAYLLLHSPSQGSTSSPCSLTTNVCTISATVSGSYSARIMIRSNDGSGDYTAIEGVSIPISVTASAVSNNRSSVTGAISGGLAGDVLQIAVTARDSMGNSLTSLSFQSIFFNFTAVLTSSSYFSAFRLIGRSSDGLFSGSYSITMAGMYALSVVGSDQLHLPGSPFSVTISPQGAYFATSAMSSSSVTIFAVGTLATFSIRMKDIYGNTVTTTNTAINATLELFTMDYPSKFVVAAMASPSSISTNGMISFSTTKSGYWKASVKIAGLGVTASPLMMLVLPGGADARQCTAAGNGIIGALIGTSVQIRITSRDSYGNIRFGTDAASVDSFSGLMDSTSPFQAVPSSSANGVHLTQISFQTAGIHTVELTLSSTSSHTVAAPISGSPFSATAVSQIGSRVSSVYTGFSLDSPTLADAGAAFTISIVGRDDSGAQLSNCGSVASNDVVAQLSTKTLQLTCDAGVWSSLTMVTASGSYIASVLIRGTEINQGHSIIVVLPSETFVGTSSYSLSATTSFAGNTISVLVAPRDKFGNAQQYGVGYRPMEEFVASVWDSSTSTCYCNNNASSSSIRSGGSVIEILLSSPTRSANYFIVVEYVQNATSRFRIPAPSTSSSSATALKVSALQNNLLQSVYSSKTNVQAGTAASITIKVTDVYGNAVAVQSNPAAGYGAWLILPSGVSVAFTTFSASISADGSSSFWTFSKTVTISGSFAVQVGFFDSMTSSFRHSSGSPLSMLIMSAATSAKTTVVQIPASLSVTVASTDSIVQIIPRDVYWNLVGTADGTVFSAIATSSLQYAVPVVSSADGSFNLQFSKVTVAGSYSLRVFANAVELVNSPVAIFINPGPPDASLSSCSSLPAGQSTPWSYAQFITTGMNQSIAILNLRDSWGNTISPDKGRSVVLPLSDALNPYVAPDASSSVLNVFVSVTQSGNYTLHIYAAAAAAAAAASMQPISSCSLSVSVLPGGIGSSRSQISMPCGSRGCPAGERTVVSITPTDIFGNTYLGQDDVVSMDFAVLNSQGFTANDMSCMLVPVASSMRPSIRKCILIPTTVGSYTFIVRMSLRGSTYVTATAPFSIVPGLQADPSRSIVEILSGSMVYSAGTVIGLRLTAKDRFGNAYANDLTPFVVTMSSVNNTNPTALSFPSKFSFGNGTSILKINVTASGIYRIDVTLFNKHILYSPIMPVFIKRLSVFLPNTRIISDGMANILKNGNEVSVFLDFRDVFGNAANPQQDGLNVTTLVRVQPTSSSQWIDQPCPTSNSNVFQLHFGFPSTSTATSGNVTVVNCTQGFAFGLMDDGFYSAAATESTFSSACDVSSGGVSWTARGQTTSANIPVLALRDANLGVAVLNPTSNFSLTLSGPDYSDVATSVINPALFPGYLVLASLPSLTVAGSYALWGMINADTVSPPMVIRLQPNVPVAAQTLINWPSAVASVSAGQNPPLPIEIIPKDQYGNLAFATDATSFSAQAIGKTSSVSLGVTVTKNGANILFYSELADTYSLNVQVNGVSIPKAKASIAVYPAAMNLDCSIISLSKSRIQAGSNTSLSLMPFDIFGNAINASSVTFLSVQIGASLPSLYSAASLAQSIMFSITAAGSYSVDVLGLPLGHQSLALLVLPGDISLTKSSAYGDGLVNTVLGQSSTVCIRHRDAFGNIVSPFTPHFNLSLMATVPSKNIVIRQFLPPTLPPDYCTQYSLQSAMDPATSSVTLSIVASGSTSVSSHLTGSPILISIKLADAPDVLSVTVTPDGSTLLVAFSMDTDRGANSATASTKDCSMYFASSSMVSFGTTSPPICSWRNASALVVTLGVGSNISLGDSISVGNGKLLIRSATGLSKPCNATQVLQLDPSQLAIVTRPNILISGSNSYPSCISSLISLTASVVSGSAGRTVTMAWSVQQDTWDAGVVQAAMKISNPTTTSSTMQINATYLQPGVIYTFGISASNWLGGATVVSKSISVVPPSSLPLVYIVGSDVQSIPSTGQSRFEAKIQPSSCGSNTTSSYGIYWSISPAASVVVTASSSTPWILIAGSSLSFGQKYVLTVTVSDGKNSSSATTQIARRYGALVCSIRGGSRIASNSSDLVLDASDSYDPDQLVDYPMIYQWSCSMAATGGQCFLGNGSALISRSDAKIVIPKESLLPGNLTVTLQIQKYPGRSAQSTANIEMVKDNVLSLALGGDRLSGLDSRMPVRILVKSNTALQGISWSIFGQDGSRQNNLFTELSPESSPYFVFVPTSSLNIFQGYSIRVDATSSNLRGYVSSPLTFDTPPQGGSCSANNVTSGSAVFTSFQILCDRWVDDDQDLPLSYSAYRIVATSALRILISSPSVSPTLSIYLPPGNPVVVDACVADVWGCPSCTRMQFAVSKPSLSVQGTRKLLAASSWAALVSQSLSFGDGNTAMQLLLAVSMSISTISISDATMIMQQLNQSYHLLPQSDSYVTPSLDALASCLKGMPTFPPAVLSLSNAIFQDWVLSLPAPSNLDDASTTVATAIGVVDIILAQNAAFSFNFVANLETAVFRAISTQLPGQIPLLFNATTILVTGGRVTSDTAIDLSFSSNVISLVQLMPTNTSIDYVDFNSIRFNSITSDPFYQLALLNQRTRTSPSSTKYLLKRYFSQSGVISNQTGITLTVKLGALSFGETTLDQCALILSSASRWNSLGCLVSNISLNDPSSMQCQCFSDNAAIITIVTESSATCAFFYSHDVGFSNIHMIEAVMVSQIAGRKIWGSFLGIMFASLLLAMGLDYFHTTRYMASSYVYYRDHPFPSQKRLLRTVLWLAFFSRAYNQISRADAVGLIFAQAAVVAALCADALSKGTLPNFGGAFGIGFGACVVTIIPIYLMKIIRRRHQQSILDATKSSSNDATSADPKSPSDPKPAVPTDAELFSIPPNRNFNAATALRGRGAPLDLTVPAVVFSSHRSSSIAIKAWKEQVACTRINEKNTKFPDIARRIRLWRKQRYTEWFLGFHAPMEMMLGIRAQVAVVIIFAMTLLVTSLTVMDMLRYFSALLLKKWILCCGVGVGLHVFVVDPFSTEIVGMIQRRFENYFISPRYRQEIQQFQPIQNNPITLEVNASTDLDTSIEERIKNPFYPLASALLRDSGCLSFVRWRDFTFGYYSVDDADSGTVTYCRVELTPTQFLNAVDVLCVLGTHWGTRSFIHPGLTGMIKISCSSPETVSEEDLLLPFNRSDRDKHVGKGVKIAGQANPDPSSSVVAMPWFQFSVEEADEADYLNRDQLQHCSLIVPNGYSLGINRDTSNLEDCPTSWDLLGSLDGNSWFVLSSHRDETPFLAAAAASGSECKMFKINAASSRPCRFIRMQLRGPNLSGNLVLSIGSLRIFGVAVRVSSHWKNDKEPDQLLFGDQIPMIIGEPKMATITKLDGSGVFSWLAEYDANSISVVSVAMFLSDELVESHEKHEAALQQSVVSGFNFAHLDSVNLPRSDLPAYIQLDMGPSDSFVVRKYSFKLKLPISVTLELKGSSTGERWDTVLHSCTVAGPSSSPAALIGEESGDDDSRTFVLPPSAPAFPFRYFRLEQKRVADSTENLGMLCIEQFEMFGILVFTRKQADVEIEDNRQQQEQQGEQNFRLRIEFPEGDDLEPNHRNANFSSPSSSQPSVVSIISNARDSQIPGIVLSQPALNTEVREKDALEEYEEMMMISSTGKLQHVMGSTVMTTTGGGGSGGQPNPQGGYLTLGSVAREDADSAVGSPGFSDSFQFSHNFRVVHPSGGIPFGVLMDMIQDMYFEDDGKGVTGIYYHMPKSNVPVMPMLRQSCWAFSLRRCNRLFDFDGNGAISFLSLKAGSTGFNALKTSCSDASKKSELLISAVERRVGLNIEANADGDWNDVSMQPWIGIDLGECRVLMIEEYSIMHGKPSADDCMSSWILEGSMDGKSWDILSSRKNEKVFSGPFGTISFAISHPQPCRHLRLRMTGLNLSGRGILSLAGLEFYGLLGELLPKEHKDQLTTTPDAMHRTVQCLRRNADFDGNGLFAYIGTGGGKKKYRNPGENAAGSSGVVIKVSHDVEEGRPYAVTSHNPAIFKMVPGKLARIEVDLGPQRRISIQSYCLRHGQKSRNFALRSWEILGSNDLETWNILDERHGDSSLGQSAFSSACFQLSKPTAPMRYIAICQTGENSSGNLSLSCGGLELYGLLIIPGGTTTATTTTIQSPTHTSPPSNSLFLDSQIGNVISLNRPQSTRASPSLMMDLANTASRRFRLAVRPDSRTKYHEGK